jgi:hypothetical protein
MPFVLSLAMDSWISISFSLALVAASLSWWWFKQCSQQNSASRSEQLPSALESSVERVVLEHTLEHTCHLYIEQEPSSFTLRLCWRSMHLHCVRGVVLYGVGWGGVVWCVCVCSWRVVHLTPLCSGALCHLKYSTVLYCTVMYSTVLWTIVLYCTVLSC